MALLCAACVPRSEGDNKVNPEHEAAAEVAQHLHSIEEFQRDVEPAIVAARNEFLTEDTISATFGLPLEVTHDRGRYTARGRRTGHGRRVAEARG